MVDFFYGMPFFRRLTMQNDDIIDIELDEQDEQRRPEEAEALQAIDEAAAGDLAPRLLCETQPGSEEQAAATRRLLGRLQEELQATGCGAYAVELADDERNRHAVILVTGSARLRRLVTHQIAALLEAWPADDLPDAHFGVVPDGEVDDA